MVVEVPLVAMLPNGVVQSRMLKPFRYHTAGTIMAGKLAQDRGWAINIGMGKGREREREREKRECYFCSLFQAAVFITAPVVREVVSVPMQTSPYV